MVSTWANAAHIFFRKSQSSLQFSIGIPCLTTCVWWDKKLFSNLPAMSSQTCHELTSVNYHYCQIPVCFAVILFLRLSCHFPSPKPPLLSTPPSVMEHLFLLKSPHSREKDCYHSLSVFTLFFFVVFFFSLTLSVTLSFSLSLSLSQWLNYNKFVAMPKCARLFWLRQTS